MNMLQSKYIHLKGFKRYVFSRFNLPRSIVISPIDPIVTIVNQIVCANSTILLTFSPLVAVVTGQPTTKPLRLGLSSESRPWRVDRVDKKELQS